MPNHAPGCPAPRRGICNCGGNVDAGTAFGLWDDETSRLMYRDAMPALLSGVNAKGKVLDLGGGNGLLRRWFDRLTTVDTDAAKQPDVLADITTYRPDVPYNLVVLRYVLHYLPDSGVRRLLAHVATYHHGPLLVVQFVAPDEQALRAKQANSVNETKWFRTEEQLRALLAPWEPVHRVAVEYDVVPEFYTNRLAHPAPTGHPERVVAYTCKVSAP